MFHPAAPLLLAATLLALPAGVHAQAVNRCVGADGRNVYSDQPCQSEGAVARQGPFRALDGAASPAPVRPAAAGAHGFTTGTGTVGAGCARSIDSLLLGVRGALESGDVNRLATHYHWTGTSARGGRYLMDELEAIARRPLVAIDFVYPEPLPTLPEATDYSASGDFAPAPPRDPATAPQQTDYPMGRADGSEDGSTPAPSRQTRPRALRIEQASSATDAGSARTDFLLRRNAGCWWIEL
ncbi:hypothetical protein GCM10011521_02190 [Arenimonas soli]|uniref:DUF4124 domain-containing protein n=1 Tax=Arenimonas soli TaxID=2269504 RepID=A0ABQ1HB50_9GAMM|nr:DUF4124 domain-containing protein [Arenimonas soli]GGA67616.1 hypothetical protein GCM10011521_02190 [Arenimonas soli]